MSAQLDVKNISLSIPSGHIIQHRKTILKNISFNISSGAATAYLGVNGAGKTSTFRILCGLCKADEGEIYFDGNLLTSGIPPKKIGFMPEHPYFYKNLTPRELLTGLGKLSGMNYNVVKAAIVQWAEKLHFSDVLDQHMGTCSKGQVQRVGLTQALMHQPDFLLLDEPLSGLDPLGRELVRNVIQSEIKRGATLLFSSHILSDAEAMCERVIVLQEGSIAYSGNMQALLASQEAWLIHAILPDPMISIPDNIQINKDLNGSSQIKCHSEKDRNHIIELILKADGATLISVTPEHRTLEQAFVELLKGKDDETNR